MINPMERAVLLICEGDDTEASSGADERDIQDRLTAEFE